MPGQVQVSFEQQLAIELLVSERRRLSLIAALAAVVFIYCLVLVVFASLVLHRPGSLFSQQTAQVVLPGLFFALLGYALFVRGHVKQSIKKARPLSLAYRYGVVATEVSLLTLVMFVLGQQLDPVRILVSPLVILYAAFIATTALQMDPRVSIAAAVVAVVEYVGYFVWTSGEFEAAGYPVWLTELTPMVGRCLILALVGGAAAFVASQFKARVFSLLRTTEERNRVTATFGRHVSPQVVDRLIEQGGRPISEMRHVCVMFLDIRNFTTLSEGRDPEELVALLNSLLEFMIEAVNRNDGFINKFLGDGFMAVFGAPLSGGPDTSHAVQASREILEELSRYNDRTGHDIRVGIGLHAGEVLTGNVGSQERTEYTVMGDVVNVAARIESLNKQFSSRLLLSQAVYVQLAEEDQSEAEDLGLVRVKGRGEPVHVFRLA